MQSYTGDEVGLARRHGGDVHDGALERGISVDVSIDKASNAAGPICTQQHMEYALICLCWLYADVLIVLHIAMSAQSSPAPEPDAV